MTPDTLAAEADTLILPRFDETTALQLGAILLDLADVLFDNAERYRRWAARWRQAPRRKHDEHQQLLKATLARDVERAVELLRVHISHTEQLVSAALAGKGARTLQ